MQMKELKILSRFNNKIESFQKVYYDLVIWKDDLMMSSDGRILAFCKTENNTEGITYYNTHDGVEKIDVGDIHERYEKLMSIFNDFDLFFTFDFSDFILPTKLCSCWKNRYSGEDVELNLEHNEVAFEFDKGWENGGVTATYVDVLKNIDGVIFNFKLPIWYIINIIKYTKNKKLQFSVNTTNGNVMIETQDDVSLISQDWMFLTKVYP